jgi:hypothetical protein
MIICDIEGHGFSPSRNHVNDSHQKESQDDDDDVMNECSLSSRNLCLHFLFSDIPGQISRAERLQTQREPNPNSPLAIRFMDSGKLVVIAVRTTPLLLPLLLAAYTTVT